MSELKVKICGITNTDDAHLVMDSGADMLGMIVDVPVETPRKISIDEAEELAKEIGDATDIVVVLCPRSVEEVENVVRRIEPFGVQLHGFESEEFLKSVRDALPAVKLIKTVHVAEDGAIHGVMPEADYVDFILLDTFSAKIGGTGKKHSWAKSKELVEQSAIPVILSGGLRPENVEEAIKEVQPYGVDVASGVESSGGRKSKEKVLNFVRNARCTSTSI
ncbi:N-(5'-phosphoribosyl)anthranilate isomerase [ANME-1 cluster archaeon GoMg4]|nr:N-(5'-phosphoribosyl)anthranilate isomerase [ANME-1 cluster archaeon GoMg4]